MSAAYELVRLANGTHSVRSLADGETFHPVEGPVAEAEMLYIEQLRLRERIKESAGEFVIWDVGLGAGGNVITAIRHLGNIRASLRIVSFDRTLDALRFAVEQATPLQFPLGFEPHIGQLIQERCADFRFGDLNVHWEVTIGDFPEWLTMGAVHPAPHAIFYDAFSPARNPEMWTLTVFENLFRRLDSARPCSLATFSRSSMARVTMLLGGFFVGVGKSLAGKEETTIAANRRELILQLLDAKWLQRVDASRSAEPLQEKVYRQAPLSEEMRKRVRAHAQFRSGF